MPQGIKQTTGHAVVYTHTTDPSLDQQVIVQSTYWENISWKRIEKHVQRLQERIYRAAQHQQWKKVRSLQKLLAMSYYVKLLMIREVTEYNTGKNTPGIDNKLYDTDEKRRALSQEPFDYRSYQSSPVKRVFIPKNDGTQRPLGIPTMKDRIIQAIIKTVLEPESEARFEPHSYGFRPNRCTMDAIAHIYKDLGWSESGEWVLDADISKCFDSIAHEPLLQRIPVFKQIITDWLKAGVLQSGTLTETLTGTPQGGIISPLLANIALDGLERLFSKHYWVHVIRYADDFVIIAPSKGLIETFVLPKVTRFLAERGLQLNLAKTHIIHRTRGFNFLGFTLKYFNTGKKPMMLVKAQRSRLPGILQKIKAVFKTVLYTPLEQVLEKVNTIIRGWVQYYQYTNDRKIFSYLSRKIWEMTWRILRHEHPSKSKKWIYKHYYQQRQPRKWVLAKERATLFDPTTIYLKRYPLKDFRTSPYAASQ